VDEVCSRLMAVSQSSTRIQVDFEVREGAMKLVASVDGQRRDDREFLTEWSRVILEAIADEIALSDGGEVGISLSVTKGAG